MRRIKAFITNSTDERAWEEEFDVTDNADATKYVQGVIDGFNNSLRPHERPRRLVGNVEEAIESEYIQQHMYEKTNLVTLRGRNGMYDAVRCSICGVTGKRYGIGRAVQRDAAYRAKCYDNCTTTLKHQHRPY